MFIRPAAHPVEAGKTLLVRYPGTFTMLPSEGAEVPDSPYWTRRVMQGDVEITPPPPSQTPAPEPHPEPTPVPDQPAPAPVPAEPVRS